MLINVLRTAIVSNYLENPEVLRSVQCLLAPCQPESDYDRYESWIGGFNARLRVTNMPDDQRDRRLKNIHNPVTRDGWVMCDVLLCPEKYPSGLVAEPETKPRQDFQQMNKFAAADILNVSFLYIEKLLSSGELKSLSADNVIEFKDERDRKRREALDEMSAVCQEAGLYDEED